MNANRIMPILAVLLLLSSQNCAGYPKTQPGKAAIGFVQRVNDTVEHNDVRLTRIDPLFQNDALRLYGGGEGLLYVGQLALRMFNDTALKEINVESAPDQPLSVRLFLEAGGFTGTLTETGGQAVFTTPGGATIRVYGTTFFIVFDSASGQTTAGNFEGSLEFESGGSNLPVPPGSARHALEGQPPSPEQPIPFSSDEFEQRAREQASPVAALDLFPPIVDVITPPPIEVDVEPPNFGGVTVAPRQISIGSECSDADGMAQITVIITDPGGIAGAEASWSIGNQSGSVPMERMDEQTFTARVGPAQEAGEMLVLIYTWDSAGNQAPALSLYIPVQFCVG